MSPINQGIVFVEAQGLWSDQMLLEIPAKADDQAPDLEIGLIDGNLDNLVDIELDLTASGPFNRVALRPAGVKVG